MALLLGGAAHGFKGEQLVVMSVLVFVAPWFESAYLRIYSTKATTDMLWYGHFNRVQGIRRMPISSIPGVAFVEYTLHLKVCKKTVIYNELANK